MNHTTHSLALFLRDIRLAHTVFALPFIVATTVAAVQTNPHFYAGTIVWKSAWILVAAFAARAVAMGFNRVADAKLDARNPRTADRAIPAGQLSINQAYLFLYISAFLFAGGTFLFWRPIGLSTTGPRWFGYGNYWPVWLSLPTLLFICLYSYTKRFTWASHFWLGASLMLAPVGTWVAVSPPIGPVISSTVLILGFAVLLWTAGFDIIYACQDINVDRRDGLYSIPARLGLTTALWISRTCHSLASETGREPMTVSELGVST